MRVLAGVVAEVDVEAWLRDALVRVLEANERWEQVVGELWVENEWLGERDVQREAELGRVSAELVVLSRLVLGRLSE